MLIIATSLALLVPLSQSLLKGQSQADFYQHNNGGANKKKHSVVGENVKLTDLARRSARKKESERIVPSNEGNSTMAGKHGHNKQS